MDLRPGLRVLEDEIDATTLTMTLLGDEEGLIVDTGLPQSLTRVILPRLNAAGRSVSWIRTIVNTHCHADHVGGNHALVELVSARVLIHQNEAGFLADPGSFVLDHRARYSDGSLGPIPSPDQVREEYGSGTPPDAQLQDGDTVQVDGQRWRVIHTPGHSPGGICLYDASTGTLITGDAIQAEGTTSCDLAFYFEAAAYGQSLDRIAKLPVETIIAGHPFKPFSSAVLVGPDARRFLDVSRAAHARYREQVEAIARGIREPLSTPAIAAELTRRNGFDRCVGAAVHTTRAHLEELRAQGQTQRVYRHGGWHWLPT